MKNAFFIFLIFFVGLGLAFFGIYRERSGIEPVDNSLEQRFIKSVQNILELNQKNQLIVRARKVQITDFRTENHHEIDINKITKGLGEIFKKQERVDIPNSGEGYELKIDLFDSVVVPGNVSVSHEAAEDNKVIFQMSLFESHSKNKVLEVSIQP